MKSSFSLSAVSVLFLLMGTGLSCAFAATAGSPALTLAPQPAPACVVASFSSTGSPSWSTVSLKVTNQCTVNVDFQNSAITFQNTSALSVSYWFQSNTLSYPVGPTQITSQPATSGGYTATVPLQFPTDSGWPVTALAPGRSFTVFYGVPAPGYVASSVKVWLGTSIATGEIDLSNTTAQPAGVSATAAVVDIAQGGQVIARATLPWLAKQAVTGLAAGSYSLQPESVTDSQGNVYQGTAAPASLTVQAGKAVIAVVSYAPVTLPGSLRVLTPALPAALSGYTGTPAVTFTRTDTGSALVQSVPWNATTTVTGLSNNVSYQFSSPVISWNANHCTPTFTPGTLVSSATSPQTTTLGYQCVPVQQDNITLKVSGLPATQGSVSVSLIPSDGSSTVVQPVSLSSGSGTATVTLADGVIYNVSASTVSGYTALFSPQPLTASPGLTETVTFQPQSTGRIMTYIPGWKTPPLATDLAAAGYTNAIVAFGVFSTSQPGVIVPAFDTVTQSYIASLHNAGIKVSLSLGGASTSIANTSINFHDVVTKAGSASAFQATFVKSVESMVTQYGFDGIDIDIESGLTASGTFTHPTGDIALLAAIINQLHADHPSLLISLVPQTANVAATPGFDATWGNYASLVMQTYPSLSWVGIQMYNAGCTFGIDDVCYDPGKTASPDASVANATDLLADWPAKSPSGGATGFQPYISYLQPSQVVLGYLAPNKSGTGDGSPVIPVSTIKRAIQCLTTAVKSATSCDTYVPPKTYPGFGGVFNWEVTFDQSNGYAFAKGLTACVQSGNCLSLTGTSE